MITREVTNLYFLTTLVNVVQHRVTVGIFNGNLIINLGCNLPPCSKLLDNFTKLEKLDPAYISPLFYIFLIAFPFSKGTVSKNNAKVFI